MNWPGRCPAPHRWLLEAATSKDQRDADDLRCGEDPGKDGDADTKTRLGPLQPVDPLLAPYIDGPTPLDARPQR